MNCTLCNTFLEKKAGECYFICQTCGAYVKHHKHHLDSKLEKETYEQHNNDVNDARYQNFTSPITNAILRNQTQDQLGLDYGCGTGPVIAKQLAEKGFKVKLYDPYFHPDPTYLNYQYAYIFSCEVFEHFYNPKQEIEKLLRLLKPDGRLYVMTHMYDFKINFPDWYYLKDPTHVFIYTQRTFAFIAQKYQLVIEEITGRLAILKKLPAA